MEELMWMYEAAENTMYRAIQDVKDNVQVIKESFAVIVDTLKK